MHIYIHTYNTIHGVHIVEEKSGTYRHKRRLHGDEVLAREFAHLLRVLRKLLVLNNVKRGNGNLAAKGVATECRAVLARLDAQDHLVRSQHC